MHRIDRRTYLAAVAGGTLVVAGCVGDRDTSSDAEPPAVTPADADDTGEVDDEPGEADEPDTSTESETSAEVGERIEIGDLEVLVYDIDRIDGTIEESDDDDDEPTVAVVDLAAKYVGDEEILVLDDHLEAHLLDEDGDPYECDDDGGDDDDDEEPAVTESRLAPGEVVRGSIVCEIDDGTDALVLELESTATDETVLVKADSESEQIDPLEVELADDALGFSEGVERAGVELTVTTLEQGNNLGGFMQSDEGYETVAVGVTIENTSGRDRALSSGQVELKDEVGRRYDETPGALRTLEGFEDEVLESGDEHEGKIAYQIEEGVDDLYWIFDFSEWGDEQRVVWQLR